MNIPPFLESPTWLVVMAIVLIVLVSCARARKRREWMQRQFGARVCRACGTNCPPHASFCRRCGARL